MPEQSQLLWAEDGFFLKGVEMYTVEDWGKGFLSEEGNETSSWTWGHLKVNLSDDRFISFSVSALWLQKVVRYII